MQCQHIQVHIVQQETDDLLAVGNNHSETVGDMFRGCHMLQSVSYARDNAPKQKQKKLCNPCTSDHLRPANAVAKADVSGPLLWETAPLCWAAAMAGLKPIGETAPDGERLPLKEKGDGPELSC